MTEHEDNRVHFLLDHLNVTGQVTLNEEDMLLILRHQRELGIEESKGYLEQIRWERDIAISQLEDIGASFGLKMSLWLAEHDKEVRDKTIEEIIDSVDKMNNSGSHCVEDYCEDADSCTDCMAKAILRMLEQMKGEQND